MMKSDITSFLVTFCIAIGISACADIPRSSIEDSHVVSSTIDTSSDREFKRNLELWRSKGINNYRMEIEHHSLGFTPSAESVSIEVRHGRTEKLVPVDPDDKRRLAPYEQVSTIPKLFNLVSEAKVAGHEVTVEFDNELGYPKQVEIRPKNSNGWGRYSVIRFEQIAEE